MAELIECEVYRRVSIQEAQVVSRQNPQAKVVWRPDANLPEESQYALVYNE